MIVAVEIHNFQSHENSKFNFHPGTNIIIGSTGSGKTACIRALRWVIWNRPSGDALRSWWGGDTWVRIDTEKGYVVRSKDKIDKYVLYIHNKKEELEFKAFSTGVPEEISAFFNISEVNLQMQLDSPYLISKTPGEIASHFNKIAKLEEIDISNQNINNWIRKINSNISYQKDAKEKAIADLAKYDFLEKAEIKLELLETQYKRLQDIKSNRKRLADLLNYIQNLQEEINLESSKVIYEELLNKIIKNIEEKQELEKQHAILSNISDDIKEIKEEIKQNGLILLFENSINTLIALYQTKRERVFQRYQLIAALENINSTKKRIQLAKAKYNTLHKEFDEVFPEICPLCNK
jgi:DNA repair protein SbcC/Rad50